MPQILRLAGIDSFIYTRGNGDEIDRVGWEFIWRAPDGSEVLAVNQWEDPDLVFEFTGRLSLEPTFPILFDRESRIAEEYRVKGLPTTFLIDKQGRLRYQAIGGREFDHPEIEALIDRRLQARQEKNWAEADRIRDELAQAGVILEDGAGETTWRRG